MAETGGGVIGMNDYIETKTNKLFATPIKALSDLAKAPQRFKFYYDQGPHPKLQAVEALDSSDNFEAGLANAILQR